MGYEHEEAYVALNGAGTNDLGSATTDAAGSDADAERMERVRVDAGTEAEIDQTAQGQLVQRSTQ
jgi:hypothetical protein